MPPKAADTIARPPSPPATPTVSKDIAAGMLAGKVKLQLEYVLNADGKSATLQYVPVYTGNYIVKADTGELVNLDDVSNNNSKPITVFGIYFGYVLYVF